MFCFCKSVFISLRRANKWGRANSFVLPGTGNSLGRESVTGCGKLINYREEVELSFQSFCVFAVNAYCMVMWL